MFEFLNRNRGKADKTDPGPSTMPQTVQTNSTQRDMARLTLHHILKHHGIPVHWIAGELVPIHIPGEGDAMLLQLEIMHWHDGLVLHAPALQQELLAGLRRFDPATSGSRYLFSWKFSPNCGCPHTKLPEPGFWKAPASPTAAATPAAATAAPAASPPPLTAASIPFDLPDRDDDDDHGFAPTQIHPPRN
jgi:hypothetical protein